jgi:hypothetical protein
MTETKAGDSDAKQAPHGRPRFFTPREVAAHNVATVSTTDTLVAVFSSDFLRCRTAGSP